MSAIVPDVDRNLQLDTWIRVEGDGTITVRTGKVELGQGLVTAIARIAAEELDISLGRIRVETADTLDGPDQFMTVGSQSMPDAGTSMRGVAAHARAHLLRLAGARLGTAVEELAVDDGTVIHRASGRTTTYWELLAGSCFDAEIDGSAAPKAPEQHVVVGKPGPRIDLEGLITGTTRFVQDLAPPGVLHARVLRPPSPAARLESLDVSEIDGVQIVRDGSFVGVLAEREEDAVMAREVLRRHAHWFEPATLPPQHALHEWLRSQPALSFRVVDGVAVEGETVEQHERVAVAAHTVDATYTRPYHMHAAIGPSAALARWDDDTLTVYTHSQGVPILRVSLAEALGVSPAAVRLIHAPGPGCYGHNGADDATLDAALLARVVPGRPVLLKWMRDDEHMWEPYGPAMVVETSASLDEAGRIIDWSLETWSGTHIARPFPAGERSALLATWHREEPTEPPPVRPFLPFHGGVHRNADPIYTLPRKRIVKHLITARPLRTSSTRALGAYANVFAIESTMDELAHAAGIDPVEFRLAHLEDERARAVIEAAAERADRLRRSDEFGHGRGLGFAQYKNLYAYAAVIVDVFVDDETSAIQVQRVVIAADAGEIVDPSGLANQLEGGAVQSTSWTLMEQVTFDDTRVTSVDWRTYPILRFSEAPSVETVLLDRPGQPFLGAGEATQGPTAAAIANAVFDAVGLRLRDIPFTPEQVRAAAARAG